MYKVSVPSYLIALAKRTGRVINGRMVPRLAGKTAG